MPRRIEILVRKRCRTKAQRHALQAMRLYTSLSRPFPHDGEDLRKRGRRAKLGCSWCYWKLAVEMESWWSNTFSAIIAFRRRRCGLRLLERLRGISTTSQMAHRSRSLRCGALPPPTRAAAGGPPQVALLQHRAFQCLCLWINRARARSRMTQLEDCASAYSFTRLFRMALRSWRCYATIGPPTRAEHAAIHCIRLRNGFEELRMGVIRARKVAAERLLVDEAKAHVRCFRALCRWREVRGLRALSLLRRAVASRFMAHGSGPKLSAALLQWHGAVQITYRHRYHQVAARAVGAATAVREAMNIWRCAARFHGLSRTVGIIAHGAGQRKAFTAWRRQSYKRMVMLVSSLRFRARAVARNCAWALANLRQRYIRARATQNGRCLKLRRTLRTWETHHRIECFPFVAIKAWRASSLRATMARWARLPAYCQYENLRQELSRLLRWQLLLCPAWLRWRCVAAARAVYRAQQPRVRSQMLVLCHARPVAGGSVARVFA